MLSPQLSKLVDQLVRILLAEGYIEEADLIVRMLSPPIPKSQEHSSWQTHSSTPRTS